MRDMRKWVNRVVDLCEQSADPHKPFFYLGGPMTNHPQFNFPRFYEVAEQLRELGYNVVSPAELDDPDAAEAALESPDGKAQKCAGYGWTDFLARDVVICAMPNCVGAIFIEGWEKSSGADLESYVTDRLKKECYTYDDSTGSIVLTRIERDKALDALRES